MENATTLAILAGNNTHCQSFFAVIIDRPMRYLFLSLSFFLISFSEYSAQSPIEPLDTAVNTKYNEINPVIHPDGKSIYFTRANHPENIGGRKDPGDIWVSAWTGDGWSQARNIGKPVNNAKYNAVVGFSNDGTRMFLQNTYNPNQKTGPGQGVSVSTLKGGSWSEPEPVNMRYFYNKSTHQSGALSADGRIMLLSLESYGTYGAEDIYVSFLKSNGEWTNPQNLGSDINTAMQEMSATLLPDNRGMIFSSNGHGGFGSMDLFYTERLDDTWMKWSKPENLGPAINTNGREIYYSISPDDYAYFVSTQNSEGYGDIKRIKLTRDDPAVKAKAQAPELEEPESVAEPEATAMVEGAGILEGNIVNLKTGAPVDATITFRSGRGDGEAIVVNSPGEYAAQLDTGTYRVEISAKGFMQMEEEVEIGPGRQTRNFELSPLDVGSTFTLKNVLFQRGTTRLLSESYRELDLVARMMKENPSIKIELSGHTDNQGSARLNLQLSQDRVETVRQYLIDKGIEAERISGKGYGGSRPIADNLTEETRKLNRRVEFTIVGD